MLDELEDVPPPNEEPEELPEKELLDSESRGGGEPRWIETVPIPAFAGVTPPNPRGSMPPLAPRGPSALR